MSAVVCACGVRASSQTYSSLGVLHPSSNTDLGPYGNMVAAVIDILPEITEVFQQLADDPARSADFDPDFVQRVIMAFLPISRKVLEASAKAEGRTVRPKELERLAAAEKVLPSVFAFMEELRKTDFYGIGSDCPRSSGQPFQVSGLEGPSLAAASKTPASPPASPTRSLSASIVRLPSGASYFINHSRSHR